MNRVYYRKEELDDIKSWLSQNYDKGVKSVSFLLHSDHNFALPPYEEITEEQYTKTVSKINFDLPLVQSKFDAEFDLENCATGACPVK